LLERADAVFLIKNQQSFYGELDFIGTSHGVGASPCMIM